jgi:hypothetical protein
MYGLKYREQLPQVVADELDGLIAAIRNLFYVEHNEDGTHRLTIGPSGVATASRSEPAPAPLPRGTEGNVPVPDTRGY